MRSACAAESRLMRSKTGNSMIELRRDDERDGEQQNSVTKAVLFHAVAILRSEAKGCVRSVTVAARPSTLTSGLLFFIATHRMRTTVLVSSAGCERARCSSRSQPPRLRAAATLEVSVVDEQGKADRATSPSTRCPRTAPASTARGHGRCARSGAGRHGPAQLQFAPHCSSCSPAPLVTFPNGDDVSHHVYSFSETKTFELAALQRQRLSASRVRPARHRRARLQHSRRHARLHRRRRHSALRADERARRRVDRRRAERRLRRRRSGRRAYGPRACRPRSP